MALLGFVTGVKKRLEENPKLMQDIEAINALTALGVKAIEQGDLETLGAIMNLNHTHLQNIGVSCKELDDLVSAARELLEQNLLALAAVVVLLHCQKTLHKLREILNWRVGSYICKFGLKGKN